MLKVIKPFIEISVHESCELAFVMVMVEGTRGPSFSRNPTAAWAG
jgi:hypothetical protein